MSCFVDMFYLCCVHSLNINILVATSINNHLHIVKIQSRGTAEYAQRQSAEHTTTQTELSNVEMISIQQIAVSAII